VPDPEEPRIAPGDRGEIGWVNHGIARAIGLATGGPPPRVMTTLARHRSLFRRWLRFAGGLMPGGILPRAETELVILRVAHLTGSEYERRHHERLGRASGLTAEEIERVREGPDAAGWSTRQRLVLRATGELLSERMIADELWNELAAEFAERELIELCLLVGHYDMLAMTLNSLRVQPDPPGRPSRLGRALQGMASRRTAGSER
jgi:AhpD family alkylhydroperoxidase